MLRLVFLLSSITLLYSCEPKMLPTVIEISPQNVNVKFSHMSTMNEIAQAAMECAQIGINMQYAGSEFFDDGRIRKLAIQVTLPNGKSGNTSADLTTLQYKYYGFTMDPSGSFKIGHLD